MKYREVDGYEEGMNKKRSKMKNGDGVVERDSTKPELTLTQCHPTDIDINTVPFIPFARANPIPEIFHNSSFPFCGPTHLFQYVIVGS